MTIEELLAEARRYAKMSTNDTATIAMRGTYAQIAQACAQTAQAMMGAEARQEWLEQRAADYATDRDDYAVSSH